MNGETVMRRFDNRTVTVTGGARGMGASHARGFVAEGANVVIADILEQEGADARRRARRTRDLLPPRLVALLAVMALVLLSGCASVPAQGNSDALQYNPETGYPAVGGAWPWVFHL